jgi:hypothetical protein
MAAVTEERRIQLASAQQRRRVHFTEEEAAASRRENTIAHRQARHRSTSKPANVIFWWERLAVLNKSSTIPSIKLRWNRRCQYCNIKVYCNLNGFNICFLTNS